MQGEASVNSSSGYSTTSGSCLTHWTKHSIARTYLRVRVKQYVRVTIEYHPDARKCPRKMCSKVSVTHGLKSRMNLFRTHAERVGTGIGLGSWTADIGGRVLMANSVE